MGGLYVVRHIHFEAVNAFEVVWVMASGREYHIQNYATKELAQEVADFLNARRLGQVGS